MTYTHRNQTDMKTRLSLVATATLLPILVIVALLNTLPGSAQGTYRLYLPLVMKVIPPEWTSSYYMQTISTTIAYNLGYQVGQQVRNLPGTQNNVVVLAFGKPVQQLGQYGANLHGYGPAYTPTIASAAKQFARGYYIGTGADVSSQLMLAVGTSNCGQLPDCDNDAVTYNHGRQWGLMVNDVATWVITSGYGSQVKIAGASDMELNWNGPSSTTQWVNGYLSATNWKLFDFGDAAGCPPVGTCAGNRFSPDWSQYYVWYISWGGAEIRKGVSYRGQINPLPLIYGQTHAKQWASLSLYGYNSQTGRMNFAGTMTQYRRCQQISCDPTTDNTPEEGWTHLWIELNARPETSQPITWSTDIIYSGR